VGLFVSELAEQLESRTAGPSMAHTSRELKEKPGQARFKLSKATVEPAIAWVIYTRRHRKDGDLWR